MRHNRPGAAGQANKFARAALCERLDDESRPNLVARAGVNHSALTHNNRGAGACPLLGAFFRRAIALPAPITIVSRHHWIRAQLWGGRTPARSSPIRLSRWQLTGRSIEFRMTPRTTRDSGAFNIGSALSDKQWR